MDLEWALYVEESENFDYANESHGHTSWSHDMVDNFTLDYNCLSEVQKIVFPLLWRV